MIDKEYEEQKKQIYELKDQFISYFRETPSRYFGVEQQEIENYTRDFNEIYPARPMKKNVGGGGLIPNYWLYVLVRILKPIRIIESGVFRGQSSWLLRQAQPNAEIHCFDINLKNLQYHDESINFYQHDWMEVDVRNVTEGQGLVFFDDHINQAKRLRQAHDRGFRWLVFDDNVPVDQIHRVGLPALPSIGMLMDNRMKEGEIITWKINGKDYSYFYKLEDTYDAKELIEEYFVLPTYTCLTLVRLK